MWVGKDSQSRILNKAEIGEFHAEAPHRSVGGRGHSRKTQACFVNGGGAENLGIAQHALLRPSGRHARKTRDAVAECERSGGRRIVEDVVDKPISRFLVQHVYPLSCLIIAERAIQPRAGQDVGAGIRQGKVFQKRICRRRERPGRDDTPGENASRRVTAVVEAVRLSVGNPIAEPIRQHLGPVRAIYGGPLA